MCKRLLLSCVLVCLACLVCVATGASAQRARRPQPKGTICGDPTLACKTGGVKFEPYDLPFRVPTQAVIWESEPFYAVILKSIKASEQECEKFVPEDERLAAQLLFPRHKVFTDRGCGEPGETFYAGTVSSAHFMAVYAGRTRAEANRMLARVKATGKFPGANVRRMHIGFNGT